MKYQDDLISFAIPESFSVERDRTLLKWNLFLPMGKGFLKCFAAQFSILDNTAQNDILSIRLLTSERAQFVCQLNQAKIQENRLEPSNLKHRTVQFDNSHGDLFEYYVHHETLPTRNNFALIICKAEYGIHISGSLKNVEDSIEKYSELIESIHVNLSNARLEIEQENGACQYYMTLYYALFSGLLGWSKIRVDEETESYRDQMCDPGSPLCHEGPLYYVLPRILLEMKLLCKEETMAPCHESEVCHIIDSAYGDGILNYTDAEWTAIKEKIVEYMKDYRRREKDGTLYDFLEDL